MATRDTRWPAGTPNWVDLSVPDVAAATEFYGSVLGWSFHDTGSAYGGYRICMVDNRSVAGIAPEAAPGQPTAWLVYLASDDVDGTAKLINDNGGQLISGPNDIPDVGRIAVALDSTGGAFGVFQGEQAIGVEVVDEPGTLVWEDARLSDVAEGRRFYTAVFGYEYREVPGLPLEQYGTFGAPDRPWGGMGGMMGAPDGSPSHWLAYFTVADIDASVRAVRDGGGTVVREPEHTPFGRIGTVRDPFGAEFGLHSELPG
ncbi:MAG TPA: VOC family protein [Pseudonocardia sp.]|jgi:hypothetical protein